ncbi:MAG: hypothetical protein WAV50_01420 [Minisyncoccia bacterium]
MAWIEELQNIRHPMFGAALLGGLLIFAPGLSYLFFFERALFIQLETIKILTLSVAIIAPFFIFNTILFAYPVSLSEKRTGNTKANQENPTAFISILLSLFVSGAVLYIGLAASYFLSEGLQLALTVGMVLQALLTAGLVLPAVTEARKKA